MWHKKLLLGAALSFLFILVGGSETFAAPETKLLAPDGAEYFYFGWSVSISGDVALVGVPNDDDKGDFSGSAYVFRKNGSSWVLEQKLLASDGTESDNFGWSVSISGDVALVGANGDNVYGSYSGSAYVFRRKGSSWMFEQKLVPSDGALYDEFGWSVSTNGNVALVGAYGDDDSGGQSGSAYVFRWNGSSWVFEQKLLASDGAAGDWFGDSVSASGSVALVGAPYDDDNGDTSGSSYVFRWNGSSWVFEQKLLASDGAAYDNFGDSVSASGNVALVGAYGDSDNGDTAGSAYVFRWNGSSWVQEQKLLASDGAAYDWFGDSVSASENVALVGAPYDNDNGGYSGSAYVFRWNGSSWVEDEKLLASDGAEYDNFGDSVSISENVALVGAPFEDYNGEDSGAAYLFEITDLCECNLNDDGKCDMQDWLVFGQDWGRTDCNDPGMEECECDITQDGKCDMQDWLVFGQDWGRVDCP